ncbi:MAG: hypothetical protein HQ538_00880 [Parcubacteria group bacterium]|nr:hypothetical protein [Parcubacteria group bacterium]
MIKLENIKDNFKIDMIEISKGCPEACLHCGAYSDFSTSDMKLMALNKEDMEKYFSKKINNSDAKIIDYFNNYVTTYVNSEPSRTDAFIDFAELTYKLSKGKSKVIAISHGMQAGNEEMKKRLEKIVSLIKNEIIDLFVLTVDSARLRGKIDTEYNLKSYLETMTILRPILQFGRLTASLQGMPDKESPLFIENTKNMFDKVLNKINLDKKEQDKLTIDDRSYTNTGRTLSFLGLNKSEDSDVIPDPDFLDKFVYTDHKWRGMLRFDGKLYAQRNRVGKTYGDSVNQLLWEEVI